MLINLKEILKYAEDNKCAVGMFNATGFDSLQAIIKAAEKLNQPVILAHAEVHNVYNDISLVAPVMLSLAKNSKVPVCVHLDHGTTLEMIKRAINLGFTSIMIDASSLPFEENIKFTKQVVDMCHPKNISVEGEIGQLITSEDGVSNKTKSKEYYYTKPNEAKEFVEKTNVDALAIAFGTAHGFYKEKPVLDVNVIKEVVSNEIENKAKKPKMSKKEKENILATLEDEMKEAARNLDFERAMELRDILFEMKSN